MSMSDPSYPRIDHDVPQLLLADLDPLRLPELLPGKGRPNISILVFYDAGDPLFLRLGHLLGR